VKLLITLAISAIIRLERSDISDKHSAHFTVIKGFTGQAKGINPRKLAWGHNYQEIGIKERLIPE
jgi:hypothetical protein